MLILVEISLPSVSLLSRSTPVSCFHHKLLYLFSFSALPDLSYSKILFYHPSFHKGSLSPFCKYFKALKNEPCIRLCMLLNSLLNMRLVIFENLLELNPSKKSAIIVGDSTLIKATGLSPTAWAGLDKLHLEITNKSAKSFTFYEQEWRGIQLPKACGWKAAAPDTFPFLFPCSLWHLMSTHRSTSRAGPATLRREMLKLGWGGWGLEAHGMSTARASFCQPGAIGGGGMAERSIRPPRQGCEASSEEGRMYRRSSTAPGNSRAAVLPGALQTGDTFSIHACLCWQRNFTVLHLCAAGKLLERSKAGLEHGVLGLSNSFHSGLLP